MATASIEKVLACPTLPSLPAVAVEVLELTRCPDVPIRKIAEVVQNDQALSGKILKTVNSSYYGLSTPCPTIARAMGYLGLNTVKSLVLGFSLVDSFAGTEDEQGGFDLIAHWRRAIYGATGLRLLFTRAGGWDAEEAFLAGLLQDVGMLAMFTALSKKYSKVLSDFTASHDRLCPFEEERLGFHHAEVGARLGESWRLPDAMISAIRHHHSESSAAPEHATLVRGVVVANLATAALTDEDPKAALARFIKRSDEWFRIDESSARELLREIAKGAKELSRLFQLNTGEAPNVSSILSEASDRQLQHQIELNRQTDELARQSLTDGLTGVANRKHFDERLEREFETSEREQTPLAVIFMDADRFKSVNDTHGHQAGDAVLVQLAARFSDVVGERGLVCRYGGEEFSVILPGCDRLAAANIAEEIRRSAEATPVDLRNVECSVDDLTVTVSLGVAAMEPGSGAVFKDQEQLVLAADKGVYAAKKAGRNCVRAFNPKKTGARSKERETAAPSQPETAQGASPGDPGRKVAGAHGLDILLIEDDPLHAQLIQLALEGVHWVRLHTVPGVQEAREVLAGRAGRADGPDLVLCDLELPEGSGIELVKHIRQDLGWTLTPIVVLSCSRDEAQIAACLSVGANAFVSKVNLQSDPRQVMLHLAHFWKTALIAA